MAIDGILRRTLQLVRHFRKKTHIKRRPWTPERTGDIAIQETLENILATPHWKAENVIIETREEKPLDLSLMIDTSLSMTGRKIALSAVAAAVLAYRLQADAYAIIAFGSTARILKPLSKKLQPRDTVRLILEAPMLGYTNIEAALHKGANQLKRGRAPLKAGVLLTDGKSTEGNDPLSAAQRFRRLEILMTADHNMDPEACHALARVGNGHVTEVHRYRHLPERMLTLLRALQQ